MKLKKLSRISAHIIGVSAVITLVYYLMSGYQYSLWFLEPIWWIRIPEIILGLFAIPLLWYELWEETR